MKISDQKKWDTFVKANNLTDDSTGYRQEILEYAERWANLMEAAMEKGETLEACAERTSYEAARTYGITGWQHGCAAGALAVYWEHGEHLRKWFNLKTQISDEGEKANKEPDAMLGPALWRVCRYQ